MGKDADGARPARADDAGLPARRAAARVLADVLENGETLSGALERRAARLAALERRDRALAERIVRTALRHRGRIGDVLGRFVKRPLPEKARFVRAVLLAGAAQILFMRVPAHAAIDTAVRLAKEDRAGRGLAGLVNAVLRNVARRGEAILAGQDAPALDVPRWMRESWRAAWGEETAREIAGALLREPALDLSVRDAAGAEALAAEAGGVLLPTGTVRIAASPGALPDLPGFAEGAFWAQDAAAALPARLLGDVRGRRVLDLCAAPGGKTAQLAAAGARVTALDVSEARLARLEENLARLGLEAEIVAADMLTWSPQAPFDAVLLDAPCSATGTARRHPDVLHLKTPETVRKLAELQRRMLARAVRFVRPGGLVVYCVCSLQPEEGEEQAARFLRENQGRAQRVPLRPADVAGQAHFITPAGDLRTLPGMRIGPSEGLDGFFALRLRRAEASRNGNG